MGAPKWKTRLVEGEFPDRSFDIEFWQEQGDEAIFRAAWEMVDLAGEAQRGCASALQKRLRSLNEHEVKYLIVASCGSVEAASRWFRSASISRFLPTIRAAWNGFAGSRPTASKPPPKSCPSNTVPGAQLPTCQKWML